MKKIYIKPSQVIFIFTPTNIIADSLSTQKKTDSENPLDGTNTEENGDQSVWARQNGGSIWDNSWED